MRNRYQIRERIGRGGMGSIYLAEDLRLSGRLCALKEVLYDRNLPDEILDQAREQFLREATILARLDHPNLPKVSDFFSSGQRDYLVMDYVPGDDLRTLMQNARRNKTFLTEKQVLDWANQLADALVFLHKQEPPIIHRDIKPSNLKVTPDGLVKLVDFGLVKILAPEEVTITVIQGQGTALYTPLEQYGSDGLHTDVRADIYSFGATLYHLLTNTAPADARKRLSQRTERAILWAMELHPDERPESIEMLRQALLGYQEPPTIPTVVARTKRAPTALDRIGQPLENALLWATAGLFLVSLIASLIH